MILYAAYVDGVLLDQVPAESEDTAFAKLKMDYPELKGEVAFELIDSNYRAHNTVVKEETEKTPTNKTPMKVIEADKIEIIINVGEYSISKEDIQELEKAAEEGLLVAKTKGSSG